MSGSKRILIVEDEDTVREVIRRHLERAGYQVREAPDGYTALGLIAEAEPDLG